MGADNAGSVSLPKLGYSIDEAVVASGLSRTYLYEAIQDGRLSAIKAGRRTLVTAAGLQAFLSALPAFKSNAKREPTT